MKEVAASAIDDFDYSDSRQAHSIKHLAFVKKDNAGQMIASDGLFDHLGVKDKDTQDRMKQGWTVLVARRILRGLESTLKA